MSSDLEQRLREAARDAHHVAGETDLHRRLESLTAGGGPRRGALALGGLAAAAAVTVVAIVVLAQPRPPVPEILPGDTSPSPSETISPTPPSETVTPTPSPETVTPTPSPTTAPPAVRGDCSAAGMHPEPQSQPQLPPEVAVLRDEIAATAVACDFDGLAAVADRDQFTYSYGADGDPAGYWRQVEESGEEPPPMEALRRVLDTPPGTMEAVSAGPSTFWWWPRLSLMDPAETPEAELEAAIDEVVAAGVHPRDMVEEMVYEFGAYIGYRVGIEVPDASPDAPRWIVFVAGD